MLASEIAMQRAHDQQMQFQKNHMELNLLRQQSAGSFLNQNHDFGLLSGLGNLAMARYEVSPLQDDVTEYLKDWDS